MVRDGQTCLLPTNEIKNYQTQVTLSSYLANTYTSTTTVTLTGLPTSGFMYINIHLDYGLEKLNGWVKDGSNANYNLTINPTIPRVNIINNTQHTFNSSIPGSEDTISNTNEFKQVRGAGGMVYIWDPVLGEYVPRQGSQVRLYKGTTLTPAYLLETMNNDADGWYLSVYTHKGKAATYTLKLLVNGKLIRTIMGGSDKFGEGIFYIGGSLATP